MRLDVVLLSLSSAVALALRVIRINQPQRTVLDEFWYARDGCWYATGAKPPCNLDTLVAPDRDVATWLARYNELTPEHPPMAKWLIATTIKVLGFGPGYWRLVPVATGVATVALLYLFIRVLIRSRAAAALGAIGLAIDPAHVVQSRLAMLEVFMGLFAVATFLFCVLDRDQSLRRARGQPSHRRWRLAAGLAGGAAMATKTSGVFVLMGAVLLVIVWELGAARATTIRGRPGEVVRRELWPSLVLLVLVPLALYLLTYSGRLEGSVIAAPWAEGAWLRSWLERQLYMIDFHSANLARATNPPWTVPMLVEPIPYVADRAGDGWRGLFLVANTPVWWLGFAAVGAALVAFARRRGERSTELVVVVAFLSTYAAWIALTRARGEMFLFYFVPTIPFLYLALAWAAGNLWRSRAGRILVGLVALECLAITVYFLPVMIEARTDRATLEDRGCSARALALESPGRCLYTTGDRP